MLKVVDIEFIRRLHFRKGWSIRRSESSPLGHEAGPRCVSQ